MVGTKYAIDEKLIALYLAVSYSGYFALYYVTDIFRYGSRRCISCFGVKFPFSYLLHGAESFLRS